MHVSLGPGVGDGQGGLACCNSWGRKESDTTERLNWTKLNWKYFRDILDRAQLQASALCLFCPPSHVNLFIRLAFWDACQKRPAQCVPSNQAEKEHHFLHLVKKKILSFTLIGHLWTNHCVWGNAWLRSLKTITVNGDGTPSSPSPHHSNPLPGKGLTAWKIIWVWLGRERRGLSTVCWYLV